MTIGAFFDELRSLKFNNVFNPYSDICPLFDAPDANNVRLANLEAILESVLSQPSRSIWFGRDLGYAGGRRTGVALTDEAHLSDCGIFYRSSAIRQATKGVPKKERTATVIWGVLKQIQTPVFLWNAFPFHPYISGNQLSNRCHTRQEREACDPLINRLLELIEPEQVVTIGNDAEKCLSDRGIITQKVRHPSYGGQTEFVSGIQKIYSIKSDLSFQHILDF